MKAKIYTKENFVPYVYIPPDCFKIMLQQAGFKVLKTICHHFKPQGETFLFLLAESHFALHSFPEENKMFLQLSSCNKQMFVKYKKNLKKFLKAHYDMRDRANG